MHTYLGIVVALLLVFRTNISMGRYNQGVSAIGALRRSTSNFLQPVWGGPVNRRGTRIDRISCREAHAWPVS